MLHRYDVIVIGAGGAGLMAALYASQGAKTAVISKLYPTRSHTGTAQGGIGAALGNLEEDHPEWHIFDTIKGSDYLADQDAVQVLCNEAVGMVYELEHMGLPFDRTPDGRISQRPFGGHTNNATKQPVRRACHAADRTGHMILQTVYQQCIKNNVTFFDEYPGGGSAGERPGADGRRGRGQHRQRRAAHLPRQSDRVRHRRVRPHLEDHVQRVRAHR